MLNKDKVNEIVADMQEEERKEKIRQDGIADKFLENRLEYYVAMGIKEPSFKGFDNLIECIHSDIRDLVINESIEAQDNILNLAKNKVFDGLSKYNLYVFFHSCRGKFCLRNKSTGSEFFVIHRGFYNSDHEIHEWLAIEKEKEYLRGVERRKEQRKKWEDGLYTKEKKEAREWYLLFTFLAVILFVAIYIFLTK